MVKAAVRAALIFWPALNLPCGALRPRSQAQVVAVEALELARGREQAAAAEDYDDGEHAEPADATPEVVGLDRLPARDQLREPR